MTQDAAYINIGNELLREIASMQADEMYLRYLELAAKNEGLRSEFLCEAFRYREIALKYRDGASKAEKEANKVRRENACQAAEAEAKAK